MAGLAAGALDGIVVLDLTTHLSGPFCGMQLGDLGADVIKIESPQGDPMRGAPPFVGGEGAPFMLWNRNKRGIQLDLKNADDVARFWELVDGADVVLENFRPGVMKRLGLGWEALHARNPRLVLGSISGFGQTGPYAGRGGFDLMVQAMSGLMSVTGPKDGPPYRIPLAVSDVGAGLYLTIGVLAALRAREQTGEGQWVETSLLEATVSLGVYEAANYFATGERPEKLGQAHRGSSPYQVFQTEDGWLTIGGAQQNFFRKLCAMIGKPELADDPRFKANADRVRNNEVLVDLLQAEVRKRSTADWMAALEAEGIPAGPVLHHDEVFADPQIRARDMVVEVEHARAGRQRTLGVPLKLSATPGAVRRPAPTLGQHDREIGRKAD
ncbi:CaiB/BaiF CoA transferase family protein [Reyranella sp.]|uniref:CaiB/BaiF CoA transferase family protein n=1 Tax=Reyranella sp. TaxID=1929291 RepID=UPI003BA851DF